MPYMEPQQPQTQEYSYNAGYQPAFNHEIPLAAERGEEREQFHSPDPAASVHMPGAAYAPGANQFASRQYPGQQSFPAVLCYVGFWFTGFLFLLFRTKDPFVRFHAMQSLLFFGGVNVFYIAAIYIMANDIPLIFGFTIFFFVVMNLVAVVAWFVGVIGALQGRYVKLPFVGDIAERYSNAAVFVK